MYRGKRVCISTLYGNQVDKLKCLHLKGDKLKAIELINKTPEQIASLYQGVKRWHND